MNRSCSNCMWWTDRDGECRGAPPFGIIGALDGYVGRWPKTRPDDWCGAFRQREGLEENNPS